MSRKFDPGKLERLNDPERLQDRTIYAADKSVLMIDWMQEHFAEQYPGIIPVLMEDARLPLDDATADLTALINLYQELDDPVCIVDWKKEPTDHGPPVERRFRAEEIADQLRASGYEDVHTDHSMRNHSMVWGNR